MQASLGIQCVPAASNFGPADFLSDRYNHASDPTSMLMLGVSRDSPYHLHNPQMCKYGLQKVAKRITSQGDMKLPTTFRMLP